MKFLKAALCVLLFPLASSAMAEEAPSRQEALLGVRVGAEGITYYVYSGGCTTKKDFQLLILESYPPQLQLDRLRKDHCKGLVPDGEAIFFTWNEAGLQKGMPFTLRNPLQSFVVPH